MTEDADRTSGWRRAPWGTPGPRVVFVHGLFGQGKNWTTIAKGLAERPPGHPARPAQPRALAVDRPGRLPRHGRAGRRRAASSWASRSPSSGTRWAARWRCSWPCGDPELLRALVVVDIAPSDYPRSGGRTDDPDEEASPFAALHRRHAGAGPGPRCTTRDDADAGAAGRRPEPDGAQSFLLQSLVREGSGGDGWRWRLNLELLERDLGELRGFPEPPPGATFDGPVLWIAGANSTYVLAEDRPRMDALFPATRLVRIKNAGHWVHSEQPEVFLETLRRFLGRVEA